MTDKQIKILKYSLAIGTIFNTLMCFNLYRQVVGLEYSYSQMNSNTMSAIQSLSTDVWDLKSSKTNNSMNYSREFE